MGLLDGKVAVVTGAGGGLGETHAMLLAQEGASVVVNDLGGARDGSGSGSSMADQVVEKIKTAGGKAVADYGNVTKEEDAAGNIKPSKKRSVEMIDGIVSCIMAVGLHMAGAGGTESRYNQGGGLVII